MKTLIKTLEDVQSFGLPMSIDEIDMTLIQAQEFVANVYRVMDEAGHTKNKAIELVSEAFRRSHRKDESVWLPVKTVRLSKSHGKSVRNKYYKVESKDMRIPVEHKKTFVQMLLEAGARNNRKDKFAITGIVDAALSQLDDAEQNEVLKNSMKRLKLRLKGKGK